MKSNIIYLSFLSLILLCLNVCCLYYCPYLVYLYQDYCTTGLFISIYLWFSYLPPLNPLPIKYFKRFGLEYFGCLYFYSSILSRGYRAFIVLIIIIIMIRINISNVIFFIFFHIFLKTLCGIKKTSLLYLIRIVNIWIKVWIFMVLGLN